MSEDYYGKEPVATAEHHHTYTTIIQTLQNAVQYSDATKDSLVLQNLIRDLWQENPAEEGRPLVQRHEGFYPQIRLNQDSPLNQYLTLSGEDVQAAAMTQDMLLLRMLDGIKSGPQGGTHHTASADIDDILARHCDIDIPLPLQDHDPVTRGPRILINVGSKLASWSWDTVLPPTTHSTIYKAWPSSLCAASWTITLLTLTPLTNIFSTSEVQGALGNPGSLMP